VLGVSRTHFFPSAQTQNRMEGASELALLGDLLGFTGASEGEPGDKDMIELQAMPIFVNGVTEVKMQGRDLVEFPADLLEAGVSIFLITHLSAHSHTPHHALRHNPLSMQRQ
jgi:hypothetical protein